MSQTADGQSGRELIAEYVVNTAEGLETVTNPDEIDYLDVNYEVGHDGSVREVKVITTVGGPYIEVRAFSGTVFGSWGGHTHTTHVSSDAVEELGERLAVQFEENVVV